MSKGNHYIHFKGTLKGGMDERVRSPDEAKFFECWIKSGVEGYVMRSFDIKRIICPTNTRFISTKEEGFDHFRNIVETRDYITKKVDKEDINEFFRKPQEKFYFIVDRFELPRASFSQVCYCNMYMYHRIILVNHMDMFSIGSTQFKERVNKAFAVAIKHKNNDYFVQEQLRNKPIVTGVFNVLQKVLLKDPDK
jgi:hypothetical protein